MEDGGDTRASIDFNRFMHGDPLMDRGSYQARVQLNGLNENDPGSFIVVRDDMA
jgi:hypothetical protein